jgi:chitosanase
MLKIILFTIILIFFTACGGGSSDKLQPTGTYDISFSQTQRTIADQFISIFENGTVEIKYDYAEDIGDGRGITAGRAGFTSATGDMLIVIERYTQQMPDNSLAKYINELKRLFKIYKDNGYTLTKESANRENLVGLEDAWSENCQFEQFIDIQDELVDELYFYPSVEISNTLGLKTPLSLLAMYDSYIQHGKNGLDDLVAKATKLTDNLTPKDGVDELKWLENFMISRKKVLISNPTIWNKSINRVTELMDLIDAKNTQLEPFQMVIEYDDPQYSDEVFNLPAI